MGLQGRAGRIPDGVFDHANEPFCAPGGGAVVNMFSAYGGIRWESGVNRQMQYEKTQSGSATIWSARSVYREFAFCPSAAIRTPLVIMSNDADGLCPVPGYRILYGYAPPAQTDLVAEYNGEAHNLWRERTGRISRSGNSSSLTGY